LLWLIFLAWPISCFHAFSAYLGPCTKQASNGPSRLLQLIIDLYLFWSNPSILGWSDGCFQTSPRECFWARPYFHGLIILSLPKNAFYYATHTTFLLGPIFFSITKLATILFSDPQSRHTIWKQTHIRTCILTYNQEAHSVMTKSEVACGVYMIIYSIKTTNYTPNERPAVKYNIVTSRQTTP